MEANSNPDSVQLDGIFSNLDPIFLRVWVSWNRCKFSNSKFHLVYASFQASFLDKKAVAGFLMLPYLIRSKTKKMTQLDSIKHFIDVVEVQVDISRLASEETKRPYPFAVCKGELYTLEFTEFFVILGNRAIKCDNLASAMDLSFKAYYVFNISFPSSCFGVWQFMDYSVFEMKQNKPVSASVKAIAAFT